MKGQDFDTEKLTSSGTTSSDEGRAAEEACDVEHAGVRALGNEDVLIGGDEKKGALQVLFPPRVLGSAGVIIQEKEGSLEVFIPLRGLLPSEDRPGSFEAFLGFFVGFMVVFVLTVSFILAWDAAATAVDATFIVVLTFPLIIFSFLCMLGSIWFCCLEESLSIQNGTITISGGVLGWKDEVGWKGDCSSIVSLSHVELQRKEEDENGRERECSPVFRCAIDLGGTSHTFGHSLGPQDQKLLLAELAKHLDVPVTQQSVTVTSK